MKTTFKFAASIIIILVFCQGRAAADFTKLDFNLSSGAAERMCVDAKAKAEKRLREIASLKDADFRGAFVAFLDAVSDLNDETAVPMFLRYVSPDKSVRDAGMACDNDISKYLVEIFARPELFAVMKTAAERGELLEGEDSRLLEKTLLDFKRSGMGLPVDEREKLKKIRQRIIELENDFVTEVNEIKDAAYFTSEQMEGVPADILSRLERKEGKYKVTLDYPDYVPFMENAENPQSRRLLWHKFNTRGGVKNKERLTEILKLRDEAAKILGYKTHAHYVLEERMAQRPEAVFDFLVRLRKKLYAKGKPELKILLALKNKELGKKSDGIINAWDWSYYHNMLMKTAYDVDKQKIQEYFPLEHVIGEMFKVYQDVLGLRFKEIKPADAWHSDVQLFEVSDARTEVSLGRFYMDLYPRDGKYKHAAAFTLIQGRQMKDGSYLKPSSSIVANFDKPSADKPSLIPHSEVETLFHEFGHIMHQVLSRVKYQRFSGTSVARDFVETPSQMFENWVWNEEMLDRISGHYKDRSKKLPKKLVKKMIAAKNVDSGLIYLKQNFYGTYDMTVHTQPVSDTTQLYAKLHREIALIPLSADAMPEAGLAHLINYNAAYYGYMWSLVFAQDMFSAFEKEGLLDETAGRKMRKCVLETGGSREESESLRCFLGREPNENAFLKSIGL